MCDSAHQRFILFFGKVYFFLFYGFFGFLLLIDYEEGYTCSCEQKDDYYKYYRKPRETAQIFQFIEDGNSLTLF